jgi:hypothetical protein
MCDISYFFEPYYNFSGGDTSNVTGVINYWSFANTPYNVTTVNPLNITETIITTVCVPNLAAIFRVLLVGLLALLMQAHTRRRYIGMLIGTGLAFVYACVGDALAEPIAYAVWTSTGAIPIYADVWAPQGLGHLVIANFLGALFGLAFAWISGHNPLVQLGAKPGEAWVMANHTKKDAKEETDRCELMDKLWGSKQYKLLQKIDVLIVWIGVPILVYVGYWFTFWGMRQALLPAWHGTVFRGDLAAATAILVPLLAAVFLLLVTMTRYSAFIVSFSWGDWAAFESWSDSPALAVTKIVGTVRTRYVIVAILFAGATLMTSLVCWWRFLPLPAGYFYQPAIGLFVALLIVFVITRLILVFATPGLAKWPSKFRSVHDKAYGHIAPDMTQLNSYARPRVPDART